MPEGERNALFWQPDQGRPWAKIIGVAVALLAVVGIVAFFALGDDHEVPARPEPLTSATSAPAASTPVENAPPAPEPPPPPPPPVVPASSSPAPAAPAPAAEPPAPAETIDPCVAKHFAEDAFPKKVPSFDFVCTETDPRKTAMTLKARLVGAKLKGGAVTDAMKEWSILNWYELAFASIVAHACCNPPPELDSRNKTCEFDDKIIAIGKAGHSGQGVDEAIAAFDKAVQCLINFGLSGHYKQQHPTYGPERDAFKRISERSRR